MMGRNYLGLDITPGELRAVSLRRKGKGAVLKGGRVFSVPSGALVSSLREPPVHDLKRMAEGLREVLDPISDGEERIALSLPEGIGRVLLTEVENPFKSREEGFEVLKWQLKTSFPVDPREVRLDYQVLGRRENGRYRVVLTVVALKVLDQFEELLAGLGYFARVIDFHSLNLYNFFRPRLDFGDDFVLLGIEGGGLSLLFFQGQMLNFHRCREVGDDPAALFQELTRSLVSCQENFPAFRRAAVYLHSDRKDAKDLLSPLQLIFERDVVLLNPHLERLLPPAGTAAATRGRSLVAAIGAAERMMR